MEGEAWQATDQGSCKESKVTEHTPIQMSSWLGIMFKPEDFQGQQVSLCLSFKIKKYFPESFNKYPSISCWPELICLWFNIWKGEWDHHDWLEELSFTPWTGKGLSSQSAGNGEYWHLQEQRQLRRVSVKSTAKSATSDFLNNTIFILIFSMNISLFYHIALSFPTQNYPDICLKGKTVSYGENIYPRA